MSEKPNILFLLMDDQRFDTIGALGNQEIKTPNLDKIVENGTAFTHAHIPSGTSPAICMPSRAMLHSGRTLFHLGQEGQGAITINNEHTTLGEAFQSAGYHTFGIGKWHNGPASFARSFSDGDRIFFSGMWDHWNVPLSNFDPTGTYDNLIDFTMNFSYSNVLNKVHCDYYLPGQHSTDIFSEATINFIEQYNSDEPFFVYTSYLAPHDPRSMPEKYKNMYNPEEITLPINYADEHPFNFGAREIRDEKLASYPRSAENVKQHIADYYAMITHLDDQIGRILEALERSGKAENTIIVIAGDNGIAIGQHGLMGKQSHYEHSIRVPLIFSGPGVPKGLKLDQFVYLLDVYPTLCDLANVAIPSSVEGMSMVPAMVNPDAPLRTTLYFAYVNFIRSVKNRQYKLIEYRNKVQETQLFDLINDPYETHNLYGQSEYDSTVHSLRQELIRYRDEWDELLHPHGQSFWKSANMS